MLPKRAMYFLGLNAVRFFSVVSLILVFSSTIFVMVTNIKAVNAFEAAKVDGNLDSIDCDYIDGSTVPNQPAGVFWAVVASLLVVFQTIILFLSEISWPMNFFDRYFPVLGTNFGLGPLGIFQGLISTQILSHHVDDFSLVSAFFLFAVGCLNMLLGLIFREAAKGHRSVTTWRAEQKGVLPTHNETMRDRPSVPRTAPSFTSSAYGGEKSAHTEFGLWRTHSERAGYGFGRQGEKAAGLRGFLLQKPEESLPRYASPAKTIISLKRNPSSVSSTSSFASPRAGRESVVSDEEGERPLSSNDVPQFKSSPTAL